MRRKNDLINLNFNRITTKPFSIRLHLRFIFSTARHFRELPFRFFDHFFDLKQIIKARVLCARVIRPCCTNFKLSGKFKNFKFGKMGNWRWERLPNTDVDETLVGRYWERCFADCAIKVGKETSFT